MFAQKKMQNVVSQWGYTAGKSIQFWMIDRILSFQEPYKCFTNGYTVTNPKSE